MATAAQWLSGARPRTLPAAVAPVLVGTGAAIALGAWQLPRAALALLVSLALQVGVNYANDYSGGRRPYGYAGLGEVFVFVFFGLVAVLGTTYTQALRISPAAVAGAVGTGALACAILVTNNLRDVPTDAVGGKRTLAVRIGEP